MDTQDDLSPYRIFRRAEWARLRADAPMTLSDAEIVRLRALGDPIALREPAGHFGELPVGEPGLDPALFEYPVAVQDKDGVARS